MRRLLGHFLIYAALAFVVLGANPFRDQTITPFDLLLHEQAWHWVDPAVEIRHKERSDILNALVPNWTSAREQLRSGRLPGWSDTSGGTTLATPNFSTWTPGFAIFAVAPDPATGFHLSTVFNLAMAGLGMFLFLRRRLGALAAFAGAVTFEFCGFNAAWLYWPHVFTMIWAPWLLFAIDGCAERPGLPRAIGIAGATALTVLGGFPFVAMLVLEAGALYALILWAAQWQRRQEHWRFPFWYASASVLGLLLCALPLIELMAWIQQFDLGYRQGRGSYLGLDHVNRLIPPWAYTAKRVEQTMYVGLVMLLMAVAALLLLRRRNASPLLVFGTALLVVSAGLVFELWPMQLVGWMPGMAYNSWSRAISILDLALIVLGAMMIDHLWRLPATGRKAWLQGLILAIVLVQCVEMTAFFRRYNGPVGSGYYFPETPATSYLRRHSGPFDYVIADGSFRSAGTLGAYGLREWHAHQFHTRELKRVLGKMVEKPFISRTASRVKADAIRSASPLMATFNVRYLAVASPSGQQHGLAPANGGKRLALPPLPEHRWTQRFRLEEGVRLEGISLLMATYHRSDLEGRVVLTLLDDDGTALAESSVDAQYLTDNDTEDFFFPEPVHLPAGDHAFTVIFEPAPGDPRPLTVWAREGGQAGATLQVDGKEIAATLDYRLHLGDKDRYPGFRHLFTAADISVYENTRSPNGPYFIDDLGQTPTSESGTNVSIVDYRPDRFELRHEGRGTGYIIVPMNFPQGWTVRVDGVPVDVERARGVLPAVPVSGPATISFRYAPVAAGSVWPWLAAVALLLAALAALQQRWGTPDPRPIRAAEPGSAPLQ